MTPAQVAQFLLELAKLGAVLIAARDPVLEVQRHRRSAEAKALADAAWTARMKERG